MKPLWRFPDAAPEEQRLLWYQPAQAESVQGLPPLSPLGHPPDLP